MSFPNAQQPQQGRRASSSHNGVADAVAGNADTDADAAAAKAAKKEARRKKREARALRAQQEASEERARAEAARIEAQREAQARAQRQAERDRMFPPGSYPEDERNGAERLLRKVRGAGRTGSSRRGGQDSRAEQQPNAAGSSACAVM